MLLFFVNQTVDDLSVLNGPNQHHQSTEGMECVSVRNGRCLVIRFSASVSGRRVIDFTKGLQWMITERICCLTKYFWLLSSRCSDYMTTIYCSQTYIGEWRHYWQINLITWKNWLKKFIVICSFIKMLECNISDVLPTTISYAPFTISHGLLRRKWYIMFSLLLGCYRQDLPQAALPVFRLLTGRFWGFSPRIGDTLHRSRSNLAGRSRPSVRSSLPNLTLIGSGVGVYGPQNWNKFEFSQYNCP